MLSKIFFVAGLVSIIASIVAWNLASGSGTPEETAHAERWGIFCGSLGANFFNSFRKVKVVFKK